MSALRVPREVVTTKSGRFKTCISASSLDPSRPTLVLLNAYACTVDLYAPQLQDKELRDACNLVAVGLLGHEIEAKVLKGTDSFSYWDQAELVLEVLETLGIEKFYVLGTSQGGFIGARVAIRGGPRVLGVIACGSTFITEASYNEYFQKLCDEFATGDATFSLTEAYRAWFIHMGWGSKVDPTLEAFWRNSLEERFSGLEGQRRMWLITVALMDRDGIINRMKDIKCPLLILNGVEDVAITPDMIKAQFALLSPDINKELHLISGGTHYLTQSSPKESKAFILKFLSDNRI